MVRVINYPNRHFLSPRFYRSTHHISIGLFHRYLIIRYR